METYQQEMYDFLTRSDNFKTMVNVVENYHWLRTKILDDFWVKVKEEIKKLSNGHGNWIYRFSKNNFMANSYLDFRKQEWGIGNERPLATMCWEELGGNIHYGIWVNVEGEKQAQAIYNSISDKIGENEHHSNRNWPILIFPGFNFNNDEHLQYILPNNADSQAQKFAKMIYRLSNDYEKIVDEAVNDKK